METLKTILYFSIFKYPLKLEDILNFSNSKNPTQIEAELEFLLKKKVIHKIEEFYFTEYDLNSIERRKRGNEMAISALKIAKEKAEFISKFPFVEAVGVSGSLSKGYYDNDSDIDFFIICTSNRVWISRTLLLLYLRIFIPNSRKYFCVNYFISTNNLEIEEKNRYTATEIKTLIPILGQNLFEEFYKKNNWVTSYFGEQNTVLNHVPNIKKTTIIKVIEAILNLNTGISLDHLFRKLTIQKWKHKFRHSISTEDFKVALKSTKNISKHHPKNFQKRVITALNDKYREIKKNYNIELTEEHA